VAIEGMGKSAQRLGQVLTSEQTRLARESEKSTDALGDAFDTLKKRMAQPFLPIKIFIEEHITKVIEDANALAYAMDALGITEEKVRGGRAGDHTYWVTQSGDILGTIAELNAYIAQQQLRVQWDDASTDAIERLRAGLPPLADALNALPTAKTFTYSINMKASADVQELARQMGWSLAAAVQYLMGGGASSGMGAASGHGTTQSPSVTASVAKSTAAAAEWSTTTQKGGIQKAIGGIAAPGLHMFGEEGPELGYTDKRGNTHILRAGVTRALSKGMSAMGHAIDPGTGMEPGWKMPVGDWRKAVSSGGGGGAAVASIAASPAQAVASQTVAEIAAVAIPEAVAQGTRVQTEAAQRMASENTKANASNARTLAQIRDILLMNGGAKDIGREVGKANQMLDSRF